MKNASYWLSQLGNDMAVTDRDLMTSPEASMVIEPQPLLQPFHKLTVDSKRSLEKI